MLKPHFSNISPPLAAQVELKNMENKFVVTHAAKNLLIGSIDFNI